MIQNAPDEKNDLAFIRELCPDLNEDELRAAEDRFREYVDLVLTIAMRVVEEKEHKKEVAVPRVDSAAGTDRINEAH